MASDGAGAIDELMKDDETKVETLPGLPTIVTLDQENIMGGAYHRRHIRRNVGVLTLFRHTSNLLRVLTSRSHHLPSILQHLMACLHILPSFSPLTFNDDLYPDLLDLLRPTDLRQRTNA